MAYSGNTSTRCPELRASATLMCAIHAMPRPSETACRRRWLLMENCDFGVNVISSFLYWIPLHLRAVFSGELRTDKAVLLQIINIFRWTVLRQIIGWGDQRHFERRRNRYGNHLFGYWFKIGFNFGYNAASTAITGALIRNLFYWENYFCSNYWIIIIFPKYLNK